MPLSRSRPLDRKPIVTLHLRGNAIYRNAEGQKFPDDSIESEICRNGQDERMQPAGIAVADHDIVHGETGCTGGQ